MEETPVLGPIRRFFRKIMNAIRNLSGYRAPIQELFYRINNGEFSESIPMETRNGNAFYSRVRKDRLLPKDHPMHIAIEKRIAAIIRAFPTFRIMTRSTHRMMNIKANAIQSYSTHDSILIYLSAKQ